MGDDAPISCSNVSKARILNQNDGVPGSKFEQDPENYTNTQLKRWLKCRGLKLSGKRADLIARVRDCLKSGKWRCAALTMALRCADNGAARW